MVLVSSTPRKHQRSWFRKARLLNCAVLGAGFVFFAFLWVRMLQFVSLQTSTSTTPVVASSNEQKSSNVVEQSPSKQINLVDSDNTGYGKGSVATVAYAISVTGCGSDPITEGGAVLKHSIHRASSRGKLGGRYDYVMYAIYHPDAHACSAPLEGLGFKLLRREPFIRIEDIQGEFLREKIGSNGCCGEKELIKFEAYTLTDYPIVVHLDLDVLVLQPMDDIFDMMMLGSDAVKPSKAIMWPEKQLPKRIDAFYTYDYNMVRPSTKYKPVQGGFLVIRPSLAVYEEYKEIVRVGDFRENGGWGGQVGPFYGSMTFQGLVPYYYDALHPGTGVELSRCIYNQMCDNPRTEKTVNDIVHGQCRTGQEECEDCRSRPLDDVVTVHYTLCQKPWLCLPHNDDRIQERLCRKLIHEWYKVRSELEESWGRPGRMESSWEVDHFFGFCEHSGKKGYKRIEEPYGKPIDDK